jgi:DNA-binding MarR family transcriptional regulator
MEAPIEHVYPVVNLLQVATLLRDELDGALATEQEVSLAEHDVMMQLLQHGPEVPMGDLAELVLFSQSGITRLVDRLERRGLARRDFSTRDRRVTFVSLTDAGRKKIEETMPLVRRVIGDRLSAHLSDADAATLRRILLDLLRGNHWLDERQFSHRSADDLRQATPGMRVAGSP